MRAVPFGAVRRLGARRRGLFDGQDRGVTAGSQRAWRTGSAFTRLSCGSVIAAVAGADYGTPVGWGLRRPLPLSSGGPRSI